MIDGCIFDFSFLFRLYLNNFFLWFIFNLNLLFDFFFFVVQIETFDNFLSRFLFFIIDNNYLFFDCFYLLLLFLFLLISILVILLLLYNLDFSRVWCWKPWVIFIRCFLFFWLVSFFISGHCFKILETFLSFFFLFLTLQKNRLFILVVDEPRKLIASYRSNYVFW